MLVAQKLHVKKTLTFFLPWILMSYFLSACPATLTAIQVYRPVSATWASWMRKSWASLSIWNLLPVLRGLPSFIHDMAGLGTPSASHFRVISPPRVTVSSSWFEELMEGRTVWSEGRKKHGGIKRITVSLLPKLLQFFFYIIWYPYLSGY